HPRVTLERPVGQLRQLTIEPGRQIVTNLAELFVDDVEVVDEPFRRRRDRALLTDGVGDDTVGLVEDMRVVLDARQQSPSLARASAHVLRGGQALGMLLEALNAKEL